MRFMVHLLVVGGCFGAGDRAQHDSRNISQFQPVVFLKYLLVSGLRWNDETRKTRSPGMILFLDLELDLVADRFGFPA
jgi:hypothetical protein